MSDRVLRSLTRNQLERANTLPSTLPQSRPQSQDTANSQITTAEINTLLESDTLKIEKLKTECEFIKKYTQQARDELSQQEAEMAKNEEEFKKYDGILKTLRHPSNSSNRRSRIVLNKNFKTITCKLCNESQITHMFLPCSHAVTCDNCSVNLRLCPVCHENIVCKHRAYFIG